MELALGDLEVVGAIPEGGLLGLIDLQDHLQDFSPELLRLDGVHGECESVAKHDLWVRGLLNGVLDDIDPLGLESNAEGLLVLALLEALVEFTVYDGLHAWVNLDALHLFVEDGCPLFDVGIDALVNQGQHVLLFDLVDIEFVSSLKS